MSELTYKLEKYKNKIRNSSNSKKEIYLQKINKYQTMIGGDLSLNMINIKGKLPVPYDPKLYKISNQNSINAIGYHFLN